MMNGLEGYSGVLKLLHSGLFSGLFLVHSLLSTSESVSVILRDSQLKTVLKLTVYLTHSAEPAMKMSFATK